MQTFRKPYLLARKKVKLPDAELPSAAGCQKPGKQMFCFLFAGPVSRHYGEGVSKTGRKERIHQAGPWALFRKGVGAAGPHAGSGRCRRLMRRRDPLFKSLLQQHHHRQAMGSEGVQPLPAGQKFSGPGAGAPGHVQLRTVILRGSLRMAESTSAFWGGFFFPSLPRLNGCLVSHLLYKTFMPLQKWAFSRVGLVVAASFWGGL